MTKALDNRRTRKRDDERSSLRFTDSPGCLRRRQILLLGEDHGRVLPSVLRDSSGTKRVLLEREAHA